MKTLVQKLRSTLVFTEGKAPEEARYTALLQPKPQWQLTTVSRDEKQKDLLAVAKMDQ